MYKCLEGYFNQENQYIRETCPFFTYTNDLKKCYNNCPLGLYYYLINEDDPNISTECITDCSIISGSNRYYSTLSGICKAECNNEDSSVIEEDNLCLEECISEYPENSEGICENCDLKSKYNINGVCIVKDENFDEVYFILSGANNEKYNKVGSCYIIDERGDYHPEHIKSREIDPNLCPDDCPSNFDKKYDEKGDIYCINVIKHVKLVSIQGLLGIINALNAKVDMNLVQKFLDYVRKNVMKEIIFITMNIKKKIV